MRGPAAYLGLNDATKLIESKNKGQSRVEGVDTRLSFKRVLAEDVVAAKDVPAQHSSHMDGYAIRSNDVASATEGHPVRLRVRGRVRLGEITPTTLAAGEAVAVATGSCLPEGADAVLMAEEVEKDEDGITVTKSAEQWRHVRRSGADVKKGTLLFTKGRVLKAQDVTMLMFLGIISVRVFRKPKVALIATGSELTDSTRPGPGRVRNSHSALFIHVLGEIGCDPVYMGIVADDGREISQRLRKALRMADVALMLGGTSVGEHDLGQTALENLHPQAMFHGVKMDRGRVTGGAIVGGKPVVMMPGPIQGAMNAFLLIGLPLIRRLLGGAELVTRVPLRLDGNWKARRGFEDFTKVVYVRIERDGASLMARPLIADTESVSLLTSANAFVVVPPDVRALHAGEVLDANLLPGFSAVG